MFVSSDVLQSLALWNGIWDTIRICIWKPADKLSV